MKLTTLLFLAALILLTLAVNHAASIRHVVKNGAPVLKDIER